jgi:folate-binding protein YgfZ
VDRAVFREDVGIEDRSTGSPVWLVLDPGASGPRFAPAGEPRFAPESEGFALRMSELSGDAPVDEPARIARGRARHGHEIAEAFTPYEVNLAAHVHLAKGCYTGQETLQRLVTYDSVRRHLVGFAGGPGERAPTAPQDVLAGGEIVGRLTSVAAFGGGWSALAVVRIDALERGAAFALAGGTALGVARTFPVAPPLGRH